MNRKNQIILYILAFFVPVAVWIVVCIGHGIYPFGSKSIMTGDITYQFIDYLSYFKTVILSNNDLTYTFSKTMGGDMAGFSAYYLFSPFNFLLLFFSNEQLPLGLLIMIIIKCGFMSLFFEMLLLRLYGYKKESVLFAITYSLMGYVVIYFQLYAYFDDMMLLPLIIIGIHDILENPGKKIGYILSLFAALVLNYYIGYMLCIFSVLYFLYQFILQKKGKREFIAFIISSFIAGMMSMFVLLPSLLSLRGEKNSFHLSFYPTMDITEVFSRFYTDSFRGNISTCLPNIYCGVLMIVLAALYFAGKNIEKREKIASAVFIIFLLINMWINTLNVAWHGFNRPIGFPYRYSFMLTFFILLISYKNVLQLDLTNILVKIVVMFSVYLLYSAYILVKGSDVIGIREVILDAALLICILLVIYFLSIKKLKPTILFIALALLQLMDLSENIYHSFYYFEFADIDEYQSYVERVGGIIDEIKADDPEFYRIEKYFRRSHNDSMQFDYAGLTHYSSCEKKEVISYMKKLGFRDNGNWSFYDSGSTAFADSLFGVKYLMAQYDYTAKKYKRYRKDRFEDENGKEKYFTYMNQYALPLCFAAKEDILSMPADTDNVFEFQENIADAVNGKKNEIFKPADIEERNLINLTESAGVYTKINKEEEAYIEWKLTGSEEKKTWLLEGYFDAPDYQNVRIEMNGDDKGEYFTKYKWSIIDLGKHDPGEEIIIRMYVKDEKLEMSNAYLYYEDIPQMGEWADEVRSANCTLNKITSSHLTGEAELSEDGIIVFSFPYEEGWEVRIDGERADTDKAAALLLAAKTKAGKHTIELIYHEAGRGISIIISILAAFGFIGVMIYDNKK